MIRPIITLRRKRILIDIDTQRAFFVASGVACIRNHRRVLANVRRVMAWARLKNIRVISTARTFDNGDVDIDMEDQDRISTSDGPKKISYTVRNRHIAFAADGCTDLPRDIFKQYEQVILEKRTIDPFEEPLIERLLSEVRAREFVVLGFSAEAAVEATVLGLLQRGKKVSVVADAVGSHNKREARLAFRKMKAKGARLIETKKLAGTSHLNLVGACNCKTCRKRAEKPRLKLAAEYY